MTLSRHLARSPKVKICGLLRVQDALAASAAGADMLGFVFAPSRRRIDPEDASQVVSEVRRSFDVRTVGVFVDATVNEMNAIADRCDLDYVQLSGTEESRTGVGLSRPVIRAVHVAAETTRENLAARIADRDSDLLLLDTGGKGVHGGSGTRFDWRVIPRLSRPFLLAGGLDPSNVREAICAVSPWGVDVSSGVETAGVKDRVKIEAFIRAAKQGY